MSDLYHYTGCGLDSIWLINGFEIHDTPYGKGVSIDNVEELHLAIGKQLVDKPRALSGKEFRFLRMGLDMSQKRIGELAGKEAQTIAIWEKSEKLNQDADFLIRHIYKQTVINGHSNYIEMVDHLNDLDEAESNTNFKKTESGWCAA